MVGATTGVESAGVDVMEVTEGVTVDRVVVHTVEVVKLEVGNCVVHTGLEGAFEKGGRTSPL